MIKIVDVPDLNEAYAELNDPACGAVSLFVGTVRNETRGEGVEKLDYEAYESMAVAQMQKIHDEAFEKWPIQKAVMIHAVGEKQAGEAVVIMGTAAPHRQDAIQACTFLIEELKKHVPIWKKEYFENKEVWVSAHP